MVDTGPPSAHPGVVSAHLGHSVDGVGRWIIRQDVAARTAVVPCWCVLRDKRVLEKGHVGRGQTSIVVRRGGYCVPRVTKWRCRLGSRGKGCSSLRTRRGSREHLAEISPKYRWSHSDHSPTWRRRCRDPRPKEQRPACRPKPLTGAAVSVVKASVVPARAPVTGQDGTGKEPSETHPPVPASPPEDRESVTDLARLAQDSPNFIRLPLPGNHKIGLQLVTSSSLAGSRNVHPVFSFVGMPFA